MAFATLFPAVHEVSKASAFSRFLLTQYLNVTLRFYVSAFKLVSNCVMCDAQVFFEVVVFFLSGCGSLLFRDHF